MRTKLSVLIALFALMTSVPALALQSSDLGEGSKAEASAPDAPTNIVPSADFIPARQTDLYQSQRAGRPINDAMSDPSALFPDTSKVDTGSANPFQGADTDR